MQGLNDSMLNCQGVAFECGDNLAAAGIVGTRAASEIQIAMGWATQYIGMLKDGETVQFRPRGNSMVGKIESGQLCTVAPVENADDLSVGDIVLCKVKGNQYIHLIKAIQGKRFQIGNNRGRINGWIGFGSIYGKCIRVEP